MIDFLRKFWETREAFNVCRFNKVMMGGGSSTKTIYKEHQMAKKKVAAKRKAAPKKKVAAKRKAAPKRKTTAKRKR